MVETTEHRLVKAGYPVGLGEQISAAAVKGETESTGRQLLVDGNHGIVERRRAVPDRGLGL